MLTPSPMQPHSTPLSDPQPNPSLNHGPGGNGKAVATLAVPPIPLENDCQLFDIRTVLLQLEPAPLASLVDFLGTDESLPTQLAAARIN